MLVKYPGGRELVLWDSTISSSDENISTTMLSTAEPWPMSPGFSEAIRDTLAVYADGRIMSLMKVRCKTEVNKDSGQDLVVLQSNRKFI